MSEVTKLADAEATRAEAEGETELETPNEPAETPTETPTPDEDEEAAAAAEETETDDAEQAQARVPQTEREMQKLAKRVETAKVALAKKLTEIFGDEATDLILCPRCTSDSLPFGGIPGFVFPPSIAPVDHETKANVLLSVGEMPEQVTKPDTASRCCDNCDGYGRVFSGSKVNREKTLVCIACKGKGWVAVGDERRVPANNVAQVTTETGETYPANGYTAPVEPAPDLDPWGRGPDSPDYGKLPMYATAQ